MSVWICVHVHAPTQGGQKRKGIRSLGLEVIVNHFISYSADPLDILCALVFV